MNNAIAEKTLALALKFRKGATAAFGAKDYAAVLGLVGWTVTSRKEGRTVAFVDFKAPNGSVFTADKDGHRAVSFYKLTPFLKEHNAEAAVSAFLGMHSYEEEQGKRTLYGVQYDINNSGICSCCFRLQKLDADGCLVLHGYQRPGDGMIYGSCFGVGRKPLEVSVDGTSLFANILEKGAVEAEASLARFTISPPKSMEIDRNAGRYMREKVKDIVTVDADTIRPGDEDGISKGYEYREALRKLGNHLKREAELSRRRADAYTDVVINWVPDITPKEREEQDKMPVMMKWILATFI